jgi:phosphocarrier protein
MLQEPVTIQNKLGLHTRAAAKLVSLATRFESKIQLQHNERIADCKSIMAIILLGVTKGVTMDLLITGADELEARDAIVTLFNNRFGEAD